MAVIGYGKYLIIPYWYAWTAQQACLVQNTNRGSTKLAWFRPGDHDTVVLSAAGQWLWYRTKKERFRVVSFPPSPSCFTNLITIFWDDWGRVNCKELWIKTGTYSMHLSCSWNNWSLTNLLRGYITTSRWMRNHQRKKRTHVLWIFIRAICSQMKKMILMINW